MPCRSCWSNLTAFTAEINIHFSGLRNLEKPGVLLFPKLLVCMNCGFAEFSIQEAELGLLGDSHLNFAESE